MYGSISRVFLTLSLFIMVLYSNVSSIVSVPCLNSIIIFARRGCSLLCPSNSLMLFYAHESLEYHEQNSWAWTKSQKCTRQNIQKKSPWTEWAPQRNDNNLCNTRKKPKSSTFNISLSCTALAIYWLSCCKHQTQYNRSGVNSWVWMKMEVEGDETCSATDPLRKPESDGNLLDDCLWNILNIYFHYMKTNLIDLGITDYRHI